MERPADVVGIILHFRTPLMTGAALESLRAEGVPRAVLVDNSEDDGRSLASMHAALARLESQGLRIDLVRPGRNLGFAAGVSAGLTAMLAGPGRHALLLNSDAILQPGSLAAMCQLLERHGLIVPRICRGRGMPPSSAFDYYQPATAIISRTRLPGRSIAVPSGCCQLIHRDLLLPDLFDSEFFFYCEDIMLAYQLGRRQVSVTECQDALVTHAVSASARKGSLFYEYHIARAHWLLGSKLARGFGEKTLYQLIRCLVLPARALLRAVRLRSWAPLRGLCMATNDALHGHCRPLTPAPED
ncbi:MAG: glycosyltransferase family 2 protein [Pseudomonadota bacterium]|nr:glycosyltransferase family 2 protein [Pseudomonadota bacterium]